MLLLGVHCNWLSTDGVQVSSIDIFSFLFER